MTPKANCHIHLPPNFSAFASPAQAVELAAREGIKILGASNYYDHRVYKEFSDRCQEAGIIPMEGIEIVCWHEPSAREGIKINDPGNPGKIYLCGKSLTKLHQPSSWARIILDKIRKGDHARMHEMAQLLREACREAGIEVQLDPAEVEKRIADRAGVSPAAVTLQERHLAAALQEEVFAALPSDRAGALAKLYGAEPKSPDDPLGTQAEIRTHLMKAGKPAYAPESFVSFEEARDLILELGGIVSYPVVMDGMSPNSPFEASPEELVRRLKALEIDSVEFIPNRNSPAVLSETVSKLVGEGFRVTAGTEHNTSDLIPLNPQCRDGSPLPREASEAFWRGALDLVAHQHGPQILESLVTHD